MQKVWIIEVADKVTGEFSPLPGAGFPTRKEALEVKSAMQRRSVIERRQEFTRVVGHPLPRKTVDVWVVMGNYGYSWEAETAETTRKEGLERLAEYRANGPGAYKLVKRRIKREDYDTGNF